MTTHSKKSSVAAGLPAVAIALLLAIFACDLPVSPAGSDTALQQTNVALGVQQTLIAASEATAQPQQTQLASTPTLAQIDIQATLDAQATAIALQLTQTAEALTPEATLAPPTEVAPPIEKIPLVDWKGVNIRQVTPPCNSEVEGECWFGKKGVSGPWGTGYATEAELRLTLETPILIERSWPNPHLVFWYKYEFPTQGFIYIKRVGGPWEILMAFPKGSRSWSLGAFDLSKYQGEEVLLMFHVSFSSASLWGTRSTPTITWYLQNIHIDPNYQP